VSDLQFYASIVNSLSWPLATVLAVGLLRPELIGVLRRLTSLEFLGGKMTFATLPGYKDMIAAVAKDAGSAGDQAIARQEVAEFSGVEARSSTAPGEAVIDAWGLLEYQLNVAADRIDPDQPHGWPQVAHTLEAWNMWPLLRPAVLELRRLRDYTVRSNRPPSSADAARYVSVAQDLVTTLRTSFGSQSGDSSGGGG
jgi:hypothetical protein